VWTVTCVTLAPFKVRGWYTADGVYLVTRGLDPKYDADVDRIVASLDLSGFTPVTR
jgi:hypothetical protein